jgi:hypothetical protein
VNKIFNLKTIDEAFDFYSIDEKYKQKCYNCFNNIFSNSQYKVKFISVFNILFLKNDNEFRKLWEIDNIDDLFGKDAEVFSTNLMILFGVKNHKQNILKLNFKTEQISIHKKRVRECFLNDLENRNLEGARISQMLWASYFINARIIEVGVLQYEFDTSIDNIKIHIPTQTNLNFEKVKQSIKDSKKEILNLFGKKQPDYISKSWLLSKQILPLLSEKSNIRKFQSLFQIQEGFDCTSDVLNFVFKTNSSSNLNDLPEKTSLQKKIKKELLLGKQFNLGIGTLRT